MADMATLEQALINADAAGDTAAAQALAAEITRMRGVSANAPAPTGANQETGVFEDVTKAVPIGVARGVIGLAGMPGDLQTIAENVGPSAWLTRKFEGLAGKLKENFPNAYRVYHEEQLRMRRPGSLSAALMENSADTLNVRHPTSSQIQGAVEDFTGPFYKPQTKAGKYAQTTAEFLPGMIGGPESAGIRFLTRVAAPAAGSEVAGELFKDTKYEGPARVLGAIVGGGGASAYAARHPSAPFVTPDDLQVATTNALQHPDVTALKLSPQALDRLSDGIKSRHSAPNTVATLEDLRGQPGTTAVVADVWGVRQRLRDIEKNGLESERKAASSARQSVDEYLQNIPSSDVVVGDPVRVGKILRDAQTNNLVADRLTELSNIEREIRLKKGAAGPGRERDDALRNVIRDALLDKRKDVFSSREQAGMEAIVSGTRSTEALRAISRILPSAGAGGMTALGAGHLLTGPFGAAFFPGTGYMANLLRGVEEGRQFANLKNSIASVAPLQIERGAIASSAAPMIAPWVKSSATYGAFNGASELAREIQKSNERRAAGQRR